MVTIARRADFNDLPEATQLQILKDEAMQWAALATTRVLSVAERDEQANVVGTITRRESM